MPSIRTPASRPVAWHERSEWLQYAHTLFRYYSRSGRYVVRFVRDATTIAAVDPTLQRVYVNPDLPVPPRSHVRFVRERPRGHRDKVVMVLQALLAHEAGHVRHSSAKPDGLLGGVWNALEDERIERLMAAAHPGLAPAFTHIGDVLWTRSIDRLEGDPLEGVLFWRWAHDHPSLSWTCHDAATWRRVLPHVEAAWAEPDPDRVVEHARAILSELDLPDATEVPDYLAGPFVTCPAGLPGSARPGRTARAPAGRSDADDCLQDGGGDEDPQDRDGDEDPRDGDGEGSGAVTGDPAGAPPTGASHTKRAASRRPSGDEDEDEDRSTAGEAVRGASVGPPEPPAIHPSDSEHRRARSLLEEVESQARALGTALAVPSAPRTRISHESRGRFDYGRFVQGAQRPFRAPHHPNRRATPDITVVHDISGSMGRADDPSSAQFAAVRATMMLHRACELSATTFRLIVFDDRHEAIIGPTDDPERARGAIAGIDSRGGTNLAPALAAALDRPMGNAGPRPRPHVVIVYCDGFLTPSDASACQAAVRDHSGAFVLPVLIGSSVDEGGFAEAFGRFLRVEDVTALADRVRRWVTANLG